jgi:hypothetical protein
VPVPKKKLREWNDVPPPSQDLAAADEAIKKRVIDLLGELMRSRKER